MLSDTDAGKRDADVEDGAKAQDFKIIDNISSFVEWLHSELKLLPDTMSKIGDYGAATFSEMLLYLLEQQGCDHFRAFES
jgi:hypothetical protein